MTKARDLANASTALSAVSATELGYVDGVTSAIQTQLDAKTAKSTLTTTGDIYYASAANTPARLGIGSTGNVLTVASGIPSWAAPAGGGKVLQVVYGSYSTQVQNGTKTPVDTGLTAQITPSSTSSKVLVLISQQGCYKTAAGNADSSIRLRLLRNNVSQLHIADVICYTNSNLFLVIGSITMNYLDSPSSTSTLTYKTDILQSITFGNAVGCQYDSGNTSTMVLLEIGA